MCWRPHRPASAPHNWRPAGLPRYSYKLQHITERHYRAYSSRRVWACSVPQPSQAAYHQPWLRRWLFCRKYGQPWTVKLCNCHTKLLHGKRHAHECCKDGVGHVCARFLRGEAPCRTHGPGYAYSQGCQILGSALRAPPWHYSAQGCVVN
jgi:hypothetical protein